MVDRVTEDGTVRITENELVRILEANFGTSLLVGAALRGLPSPGGTERVQALADFALVYRSVAGPWSTDKPEVVRLSIKTLASRLQDRLQALTYAGAGGQSGTADMAGRTLPMVFGRCLNVTVQLIDPSLLIYQVHSGSIEGIDTVYDQGVELLFDADYPSYAALAAAVIPLGSYATSLATGFLRLGAVPTGAVTADVRGDTAAGGGKQLTVHFRFLTAPPANLAASVAEARYVLGLAGITLHIKSQEALTLPPLVPVFQDNFAGSNGASWTPSKWVNIETLGGTASVTIQSNRGRVAINGTHWVGRMEAATGALSDFNLTFRFETAAAQQFNALAFRADGWKGTIGASGSDDPSNGYVLQMVEVAGPIRRFYLRRLDGGVSTQLGVAVLKDWSTGAWNIRLRALGPYLKAKAWPVGDPEPDQWDLERFDSTHAAAGKIMWCSILAQAGSLNVDIDDFVVRTGYDDYSTVDVLTTQDNELHLLGLNGVGPNESVVYYINTVKEGAETWNGWALINGARVIIGSMAGIYILAHELCHNLGLVHTPDTNNIMHQFTTAITNPPPDLTPAQIATMRANALAKNVGYANTHAEIIRRMLLSYSPLVSDNLDNHSFAAVDILQPAEIGIFFEAGDQSTVEEAIEKVAFSGGLYAGQDRSGLYRIGRLSKPALVQHWTFDDRDIIEIEQLPLPYGVPWKSWGVGYRRNWTVQRGAELALGVAQARRQFLESEYRYAYAANAEIALAHATSTGSPLRSSLFLEGADAEAETQRLLEFYGLGRSLYRVVVKTVLFSAEIGQTIRLIYPRWSLNNGKNCVAVSVDDDAGSRLTELLVFG